MVSGTAKNLKMIWKAHLNTARIKTLNVLKRFYGLPSNLVHHIALPVTVTWVIMQNSCHSHRKEVRL